LEDEDGSRDGDDNWLVTNENDIYDQVAEWKAWAQSLEEAKMKTTCVSGLGSTANANDTHSAGRVSTVLPAGGAEQVSVGVIEKMETTRKEGIISLRDVCENFVVPARPAVAAPEFGRAGETICKYLCTKSSDCQRGYQHKQES
jgi:hypothetical protein